MDNKQRFRVDLETDKDSQPEHPLGALVEEDITHPVEFEAILYRGYSKDVVSRELGLDETIEHTERLLEERPELESVVQTAVEGFITRLGPKIPDATTLQAIRSRRAERDEPLEYELLRDIAGYDGGGIVDAALPLDQADDVDPLDCPDLFDDGTELPVRVLLKLLGANYLATRLNSCGAWIRQNPESTFIQEEDRDILSGIDFEQAACHETPCIDHRLANSFGIDVAIGGGSAAESD